VNAPLKDPAAAFEAENAKQVSTYPANTDWQALSARWMQQAFNERYMYNFAWMGRPIIQTPIDMVALQEIIWRIQPDLIIETGIAHGGSLILSASMLAMLDYCDAVAANTPLNPAKSRRRVLGIDIDIRAHNRAAIEAHPMAQLITMLEGSSIADETIAKVKNIASGYKKILDSNHTHAHVLEELRAYAGLATLGSYCLVFDTIVEDLAEGSFPDRPWGKGNNPKTAVWEFLRSQPELGPRFEMDKAFENKLLITVAPDGFLKRIR
jgi:cephalosporin hydroxylase